jgi:dTMP kinase
MPLSAPFIVLEGADGVGKSTQVALLGAWLRRAGVPHVLTREPGGTPVGEAIRAIVLDRADLAMPAETELLLILAARAAFVREVVEPAVREGRVVVADRFSLSTMAYQGYGRGLDLELIRSGLRIATGGLEPDSCLVLDLPEAEIGARLAREGGSPDRIEQEGDGFRRAVRDGYLALAASDPSVQVVDASGTPDEVHERLRARLVEQFPEWLERSDSGSGSGGEAEKVEEESR